MVDVRFPSVEVWANTSREQKRFFFDLWRRTGGDDDVLDPISQANTGRFTWNNDGVLSVADDVYYDDTNDQILIGGSTEATAKMVIKNTGRIEIQADNIPMVIGAGNDATILYDGTNLVINPKAVGSGNVTIQGAVDAADEVRGSELIADSDPGSGTASTNIMTGVTDTPTTDPGWATSATVNMNIPNGYLKFYVGTQAVTVPFWNT